MSGISLFQLLLIDAAFLLLVVGLVFLIFRGKTAGLAVLRRNFVGYLANPTGYLFILLFVALCSAGAFFPHEFFNNNLATLHQLNHWFPWIMLVYIPTITMGTWSEERRQGTDELLLTVPATDWDIVLGKFCAAGSIYTASLLFSQVANFLVLGFLSKGEVDLGLFATTYLGYWLIGLAMIALGMVGSFLTRNLTIGFIFGMLLNLPLVMASSADTVLSNDAARLVTRYSYAEQFLDFGRGVISLRGLVFFSMVVAIGLYLSVVLVGRRHWLGGRDGQSLLGHYLTRIVALLATAFAVTYVFINNDYIRQDCTATQVNSLSQSTLEQMGQLDELLGDESKRGVLIEAFISADVPQEYVKTKLELVSKLREFEAKGGSRVQVKVYDNLVSSSDQAIRAEDQYGIEPRTVMVRERGAIRQDEMYLGVAFTSGLERVVVPFFDQGVPAEYEILRSICTVASPQRKRLGVVTTDAQLFGGINMQTMSQNPKQLIIEELEKQYEVVQIDPATPIDEEVDVMMVVQPSSLNQAQLDNLIAVVKTGVPTAIFEDPAPTFLSSAPGTGQPKRPRGGMMGQFGGPPEPKGRIEDLWNVLGVSMVGNPAGPGGNPMMGGGAAGGFDADIVWQDYMPYKGIERVGDITMEWVFANADASSDIEVFNSEDSVVSGLGEVLFVYPGALTDSKKAGIEVTPMVVTAENSGTIAVRELQMSNDPRLLDAIRRRNRSGKQILAARIRSKDLVKKKEDSDSVSQSLAADTETLLVQAPVGDEDLSMLGDPAGDTGEVKLDVIFVTDIDVLHSAFINVRNQPNMGDIDWNFDNVTFVLNTIDELAGDTRFLETRKKKVRHSSLKLLEEQVATAREAAEEETQKYQEEFDAEQEKARAKQSEAMAELQQTVNDLQAKAGQAGTSNREVVRALNGALQQMAMKQMVEQRRLETKLEQIQREQQRKVDDINRELEAREKALQTKYKRLALLLPMLPPLLIGLIVYGRRRYLESESVTAARRK